MKNVSRPIFLDCHATTPVDPLVFEIMKPYYCERFGNASSQSHYYGWEASAAIEAARTQVARFFDLASPSSVTFTGGATESNNWVLKSIAAWHLKQFNKPAHFVSQPTEHKCILDTLAYLETEGHKITWLPVDEYGLVCLASLSDVLKTRPTLCSIMAANNEVGTIQPLSEIAALCSQNETLFHTDAAQALGRMDLSFKRIPFDFLSLSSHKIYGPKGVGALLRANRGQHILKLPLLHGGGHEGGLRSGTQDVPGIVGLGAALHRMQELEQTETKRLRALRDGFWEKIRAAIPQAELNGHPTQRLPHNLNLSICGIPADTLLAAMPEIACSSGSACQSASGLAFSHVVLQLTKNPDRQASAIRFGLGRYTTEDDLEKALEALTRAVVKLGPKFLR